MRSQVLIIGSREREEEEEEKNLQIAFRCIEAIPISSLDLIDRVVIGVDSLNQLKMHIKTLKKEVSVNVFKEALKFNYMNKNILNPSFW